MKRPAPVLATLAALPLLASPATQAQQRTPPAAKPAEKPAEQPAPSSPAQFYEPQLLQLAEIMGSLAYLRIAYGGKEAQDWRTAWARWSRPRGARLSGATAWTAAFNRGFKPIR